MKLMIASDLHGSVFWIEKMINKFNEEKCDNLLLLGDLLYHGPRNDLPDEYNTKRAIDLLNSLKDKILCVKGNCDGEVDEMVLEFPISQETMFLSIDGINFFATHGHKFNEDNLPPFCNFNMLLNGHTHIMTFNRHKDYIFINPGSTSIPKGNTKHSLVIYESGEFIFYNLEDGTIIKKEKM